MRDFVIWIHEPPFADQWLGAFEFMTNMRANKVIGSPGWHTFLGLAFGWVGMAGASEAWRNRLFIAGLILIFVMGNTEIVQFMRRRPENA
jgi:hypothetical protein